MTEAESTLPINYHGPEKLKPLWEDFTRRVSNGGKNTEIITTLNQLDELVFTEISAHDFIKKYAPNAKLEIQFDTNGEPKLNEFDLPLKIVEDPIYKKLINNLNDILMQNSKSTDDPESRPLNSGIVTGLGRKFDAIKGISGNPLTDVERIRRQNVSDTPEAHLLIGCIRSAMNTSINAFKEGVIYENNHLSIDLISDYVEKRFIASLFKYEPDFIGKNGEPVTLKKYILGALNSKYVGRFLNQADKSDKRNRGRGGWGSQHDWTARIQDKRSSQADALEEQERWLSDWDRLETLLDRLPPGQAHVVRECHLNTPRKTYREYAEAYGVTPQAANMRFQKALKKMQSIARKEGWVDQEIKRSEEGGQSSDIIEI